MTDELRDYIKAGAERMRQRAAWLANLHRQPTFAGPLDVTQLVERVWALEQALGDYYEHCECFAGLKIARKLALVSEGEADHDRRGD
jgi:hypothetical protein